MSTKDIITFISGAIAGKLIKDNLPDLHYKNLIRLFNKHIALFFLMAYIGYLTVIANITNNPKTKKELLELCIAIAVIAALDKNKQQRSKQQTA